MKSLSIGQVAERAGIAASAIPLNRCHPRVRMAGEVGTKLVPAARWLGEAAAGLF